MNDVAMREHAEVVVAVLPPLTLMLIFSPRDVSTDSS